MGAFENKVVIITGASSGIGAATAILFAKAGANLWKKSVICGRNEDRLEKTANACRSAGAKILKIIGDISKFENLEPIMTKTIEEYSSIDILINNAGFAQLKDIANLELDEYEYMFRVNLRAPVFLSKFAMPHLTKTKGCIVNVSSTTGLQARLPFVPYGLTKCALDHFTRGFSAECAPFGIRVNSINPSAVETLSWDPYRQDSQLMDATKKFHPLGIMQPDTIADAILFLCSAPHVTGVSLPVDSGSMNFSPYTT